MGPRLLVARNVAKAFALLGGFAALLTALGWWLGGIRLAGLFFVTSFLMVATVYWYGPRIVLASLGARDLLMAEAPVVHSTLERLALTARVERPKLYVIASGHPHAFSVGRGATGSGIALSQGLLSLLPPAELEGILAHELGHIRHRDVVVQTPLVVTAGWVLEASRIGGFLERALLTVVAPVAASIIQVLLSPKREFAADAAAARITRSPHGIADALVRLEQAQELVRYEASPVTEPLYTINPFETVGVAALFVTHPPVADRVRRLRELDPDWRERLRAA